MSNSELALASPHGEGKDDRSDSEGAPTPRQPTMKGVAALSLQRSEHSVNLAIKSLSDKSGDIMSFFID